MQRVESQLGGVTNSPGPKSLALLSSPGRSETRDNKTEKKNTPGISVKKGCNNILVKVDDIAAFSTDERRTYDGTGHRSHRSQVLDFASCPSIEGC